MRCTLSICALLLAAFPLQAEELLAAVPPQAKEAPAGGSGGDKSLLGISILGNQEAPKALVIVPWKSSQLGDSLGISDSLDDSRQPVDRDVFMRELTYYEIREARP